MKVERALADWVADTAYEALPPETVDLVKTMVLTIFGTTVAGATSDGCEAVVEQVRAWGGAEEATIHVYGGKVPAHNAVLANSTMARALDICDGADPGIHIGSSVVPVALATAELVGGCSGKELIAALAAGGELTARLGLAADYDGFDPTGIGTVFGSAAVAGKLLGLTREQVLHALALAFNRTGGSFQSNIDGSLAVRMIQAFVSQNGIVCAQLAQRGITGPKNFVEGSFGYYHLYAKGRRDDELLVGDLGERWSMSVMGFKAYPSCGATIAGTEAILELVAEHDIDADDVESVDVTVTPIIHGLVGHDFEVGENPTVNAQFSLQYCVANGILRKSSELRHFDAAFVTEPEILELTPKIRVHSDAELNEGQPELRARAVAEVRTKRGLYRTVVDHAKGFPPRQLAREEHLARFWDNVGYGGKPLVREDVETLLATVDRLEEVEDVRALVPLLIATESVALAGV